MPGNVKGGSLPLGRGSREPTAQGNARLLTKDARGRTVKTWLWIDRFFTDINLTYKTQQVKDKKVVQPVRLTERVLVFDVIWSVQNDRFYKRLWRAILDHWRYNLSVNGSVPMNLLYLGANRDYDGFIESCTIGYAFDDALKRQTFRMRTVSSPISGSYLVRNVPYAPFRGDIGDWGPGWYTAKELRQAWDWQKNVKPKDPDIPDTPLFGVGGGPLL